MKNHQINILLVDDEIYALHLLEELLKKRPHIGKIEKATRKVQALELAYLLQPDIIFQDIRMPNKPMLFHNVFRQCNK